MKRSSRGARRVRMTLYLSEAERDVRDAIALYFGIRKPAAVGRMAILELGRSIGITVQSLAGDGRTRRRK